MKFGGPLAIIVHYMYNSIWSVAKALYRTWALILLKKIIIRRLKSEITKISNIQSL